MMYGYHKYFSLCSLMNSMPVLSKFWQLGSLWQFWPVVWVPLIQLMWNLVCVLFVYNTRDVWTKIPTLSTFDQKRVSGPKCESGTFSTLVVLVLLCSTPLFKVRWIWTTFDLSKNWKTVLNWQLKQIWFQMMIGVSITNLILKIILVWVSPKHRLPCVVIWAPSDTFPPETRFWSRNAFLDQCLLLAILRLSMCGTCLIIHKCAKTYKFWQVLVSQMSGWVSRNVCTKTLFSLCFVMVIQAPMWRWD